jgi:hypothetical protein
MGSSDLVSYLANNLEPLPKMIDKIPIPIAVKRLRCAISPRNMTVASVVNNGLINTNAVASARGIMEIAIYQAVIPPALKKERTKWT